MLRLGLLLLVACGAAATQPPLAPLTDPVTPRPAETARLRFEGNRALTSSVLIAAACFDLPRDGACAVYADTDDAAMLHALPELLARRYREAGYLAATIADAVPESAGWRFQIDEGPQFQIGDLAIVELGPDDAPRQVAADEPPLPVIRLPARGEIYRERALGDAAGALARALEDLGYPDARAAMDFPQLDLPHALAGNQVRVTRGRRGSFGSITIRADAPHQAAADALGQVLVGCAFSDRAIEQLRGELAGLGLVCSAVRRSTATDAGPAVSLTLICDPPR